MRYVLHRLMTCTGLWLGLMGGSHFVQAQSVTHGPMKMAFEDALITTNDVNENALRFKVVATVNGGFMSQKVTTWSAVGNGALYHNGHCYEADSALDTVIIDSDTFTGPPVTYGGSSGQAFSSSFSGHPHVVQLYENFDDAFIPDNPLTTSVVETSISARYINTESNTPIYTGYRNSITHTYATPVDTTAAGFSYSPNFALCNVFPVNGQATFVPLFSTQGGKLAAAEFADNVDLTLEEQKLSAYAPQVATFVLEKIDFEQNGGSLPATDPFGGTLNTSLARTRSGSQEDYATTSPVDFAVDCAGEIEGSDVSCLLALEAHYTFESNLQDASGHGYDGTAVGDAAISAGAAKVGSAGLALDGDGDSVTLPSGLNSVIGADYTMAMWVNPTVLTDFPGLLLLNGEGLVIQQSRVYILEGGASATKRASEALPTGQWTHVALVKSASTHTIYYNAADKTELSSSNNWGLQGVSAIGHGFQNDRFHGAMDEVRIYEEALTVRAVGELAGLVPAVSLTSPAEGDIKYQGNDLDVSVVISAITLVNGEHWHLIVDGNTTMGIGGSQSVATGLVATLPANTLSVGSHTLQAQLVDSSDVSLLGIQSPIVNFSMTNDALAADLLLRYPFDTDLLDISGNSHHGTAVSNAAVSTIDPRVGVGALLLDGAVDSVNLPSAPLSGIPNADYSMSIWVKPTSTTGFPGIFLANGDGMVLQANRVMALVAGDDATHRATEELLLNVWTHLALVKDGSSYTIYYNGVDKTEAFSSSNWALQGVSAIGQGFQNARFDGSLDEARLYTRALTVSEIGTLSTPLK